MKIKNLIILKGVAFFSAIVLVAVPLTGCQKNKNNNVESDNYLSTETSYEQNSSENVVENKDEKVINSEINNQKESTLHKSDTTTQNNTSAPSVAKEQYTENDKTVIATFDNIEKDVDNLLQGEKTESTKDKLKGTFVTIVDFIFYDAEIK